MSAKLGFASSDPRVRLLNDRPVRKDAKFVLYFCQIFRRGEDNAALSYAIMRANELGLPCVVYEALGSDYPFASDRFHHFVLEGAADTARVLATRGIKHIFFLPRTAAEARGILQKVAERAALIVSDDFPTFVVQDHNVNASRRATCPYVVVDDCTVVPLSLFPKQEYAARTIRPKFHRALEAWLRPIDEPKPKLDPPGKLDLPFKPIDFATADIPSLVAACEIDHSVPPAAEFPGGSAAAAKRLRGFFSRLSGYVADHNEPSRDSTSHLSPYLHFGMISARKVAIETKNAEAGSEEDNAAFLEQLLVRRALAYNFARTRPDHATYAALPDWAKATLAKHAQDPRPDLLTLEDLDDARTPDELWNTAQLELRVRGIIHNYARMLWGKLPITWMKNPSDAHAAIVHLNDRYALDGRDPNGYTNISWCFGLHDRPWPERAIFGTVRSMTSRSASTKLDLEGYLSNARTWRAEI